MCNNARGHEMLITPIVSGLINKLRICLHASLLPGAQQPEGLWGFESAASWRLAPGSVTSPHSGAQREACGKQTVYHVRFLRP